MNQEDYERQQLKVENRKLMIRRLLSLKKSDDITLKQIGEASERYED